MIEPIITRCPSCNEKLKMNTPVQWTTGYIRCPVCGNRVLISFNKNVKQKKKQH